MAEPQSSSLAEKVQESRRALDDHVREIVRWHFDPATGSPFWLAKARDLDFDPTEAIQGYDDLRRFGHFQDEWLRGGPVRRWLPKGLAGEPVYVFETGGSTGVPKSRINVRDFETDYEIFGDRLSDDGFPPGADWLMLGPTGPRRLRLAIEHLAQYRGGVCFFVDLDPRWVNRLVKDGKHQELEAYKEHVIDQAMKILRAHENIHCLFTTPKLLDALARRVPVDRLGIKGIFCGGTEMNAQFNRFVREELAPGVEFVQNYGNTLMGLACPKPFDPADNYAITYYPPAPRAVFEIVHPDDTGKTVPYGETGRVMLTTLTREFFMPRFLERDEGERAAPCDAYPWDGVTDLRLLSSLQTSVVVGVY
jgi:phenylacetate-coenzyme A ligase PaaK-like adenylate-forming protein